MGMPDRSRKPLTVHEVTFESVKELKGKDTTGFDTYDEFCRQAALSVLDNCPDVDIDPELEKALRRGLRRKADLPDP